MNDSWEENQKKLQTSSEKLLQRWKSTLPKTVIMCGSGWTEATKKLEVIDNLSYESIDCLTPTTVEGHKSNLLLVKTKEAYALIFQGRKHFYEGEGWEPVINPILLSKKLGCDNCVLTNAAGGINMSLCVGDIMLMTDHINLMPTNLYGPNDNFSEDSSHVIPGLIHRMHVAKINKIETFEVWGTGKPLREFMHVDDLTSAVGYILKNNLFSEQVLNVGSNDEISINDLVLKIKKVVNYDGKIIFNSKMPDGNPRKLLDSSLISSYGWKPNTKLDDGLEISFKWFVTNFNL